MNSKVCQKKIADARRNVGRKFGFCQSSYIKFEVEAFFDTIIKLNAYALMAFGSKKNDIYPNSYYYRAFIFGIMFALFVSTMLLCGNLTLACIISVVYFIFSFFINFGKRSTRYYMRFSKLPDKTRMKWKISVWIVVVSLYIYTYSVLFLNLI